MTSEVMTAFKEKIVQLRLDALFGDDDADMADMDLEAEQHYLLALNALDAAARYATLALYRLRKLA